MKKKIAQLMICFLLGAGVQAGAYVYMDRVLFAPLSSGDYDMSDVKDKVAEQAEKEGKKLYAKVSVKGKAYYSHDYKYMADVTAETVTLARYNPEGTTHESDAPIRDLPRNAKIVDVAYSTATNAVYMKMEVGKGLYRIYRTDANYDTRRIYVQTSHIGKMAVYYDADRLFYDDSQKGIMYTFNGDDSSWRVISPPGAYRLVGLGDDKTIYAAKINSKGEATAYYTGKLGVGFKEVKALETPVEFNSITVHMIREAAMHAGK